MSDVATIEQPGSMGNTTMENSGKDVITIAFAAGGRLAVRPGETASLHYVVDQDGTRQFTDGCLVPKWVTTRVAPPKTTNIDKDIVAIVERHGLTPVLAALARLAHARGLTRAFRIINAAYEKLT